MKWHDQYNALSLKEKFSFYLQAIRESIDVKVVRVGGQFVAAKDPVVQAVNADVIDARLPNKEIHAPKFAKALRPIRTAPSYPRRTCK